MPIVTSSIMNVPIIEKTVTPLRMIFWGALLCVLDLSFSQTTNGGGFKFDLLNDALGAVLIAVGVFRLSALPVHSRYALAMGFVKVMAVIAILDAIREHFIMTWSTEWLVVFELLGLAMLAAVVLFCVAMRWFCQAYQLSQAERSWKVTTILFIVIYLIPLGLMYALTVQALTTDEPFHVDLGPAGLLLIPVFLVPLIHLFVSTSRMKRAAEEIGMWEGQGIAGNGYGMNE